jgi:hypothetical protein
MPNAASFYLLFAHSFNRKDREKAKVTALNSAL